MVKYNWGSRKHPEITIEDINNVLDHPIAILDDFRGDPTVSIIIGMSKNHMIELAAEHDGDDLIVFHAFYLTKKYRDQI